MFYTDICLVMISEMVSFNYCSEVWCRTVTDHIASVI